jgi:ACS family tartrate transporter-like MFS transporter
MTWAGDQAMTPAREAGAGELAERALVRKVAIRLIPFLFVLYVVAYLDRVNVGFAKLQMNALPWFSESVFGFGSGIFFLGYFLFEIPSNLILQKVGARLWITRIMLTWGLIAMAMLFAHSATTFYGLRFALGLAEAGFFPGVLLYMTYWFTARERARVIALFMTANAVAFIFGGPVSGLILSLPTRWGLAPWQQLFLLEGLPAVLLAFVVLWYLPDGPQHAAWLTPAEKEALADRLHAERATAVGVVHRSFVAALAQPAIHLLCGVYFCLVVGMYGISLWLPQLIKAMGQRSDLEVGLLSAIPYITAGVVMVANGFHSDRTGERRWHVAIPAAFGALGLVGCAYLHAPTLSLAALSLAAAGMWATLGPFWSLPPTALRGAGPTALAGGIALINSVGNLGGFIGPFAVGFVKERTNDFTAGLLLLSGAVLAGGFLALVAGRAAARNGSASR